MLQRPSTGISVATTMTRPPSAIFLPGRRRSPSPFPTGRIAPLFSIPTCSTKLTESRSGTAMPIAASILPCSMDGGGLMKALPRPRKRTGYDREADEDAQHQSPGNAFASGSNAIAAGNAGLGRRGQTLAWQHAHRHHALHAVGRG